MTMATIRTSKQLSIGNVTIPANTTLMFSNEGVCVYKGVTLNEQEVIAAIEDWTDRTTQLTTKSSLAIQGLTAHIAAILDYVQAADKPELIRILRVASQSVSSGSQTFLKNIGRGIV